MSKLDLIKSVVSFEGVAAETGINARFFLCHLKRKIRAQTSWRGASEAGLRN